MFVSIALEIRSLQYFKESANLKFQLKQFKDKNVLVHHVSGTFTLHFQDYKTKKFKGHDELTIEVGMKGIINHY